MNKFNLTFNSSILIGLILLSACNSSNKSVKVENSDMHTSETSLDWAGSYFGILPCADCEGIATELTIDSNKNYTLINSYLGKETSVADTIKGTFSWQNGSIIHLEGIDKNERSPLFKVEENQLRYLDKDGNEVEGELAQHYILPKTGNLDVEDKKWHLVELNGKKVTGTDKTHYLIFNSKDRRASTKAGCNIINYQYRITYSNRLELTKGISTMMSCPDSIEDEYINVLNMVDNLSVGDKKLTLNKARMAPLAVFELVE
ncbi:MAG: copper resistance protein NlpE N-terminal domain-containing protein [Bacteroidetes bacterium]|nr:copper resistance protein NlpE N-terminal domain-containing protein [Bacteroidota bacterium]